MSKYVKKTVHYIKKFETNASRQIVVEIERMIMKRFSKKNERNNRT